MKENLTETLAHIAVRLGSIATDQCLALSMCDSKDALKECIRNKSDEIREISIMLIRIAGEGGAR